MIKEQLKIKSVELRKATEEKGKVTKKFKDLVSFNRDETAKLKKEIKGKVMNKKDKLKALRRRRNNGNK